MTRTAKPSRRSLSKKKAGKSQVRPTLAKSAADPAAPDGAPLPRIGLEYTVEAVIPHEWTIQAIDARLPPVLSTPRMIQLMEHASTRAILDELPPGTISVGTRIEVDHLKAVPDGATVRARARLSGYQGRFLVFDVEATSGDIVIGRGRVFRALVESGKHGEKARARVGGS
ncbi:MAG: thioesterase family protein [Candidatus Acidiferrales bacterium]